MRSNVESLTNSQALYDVKLCTQPQLTCKARNCVSFALVAVDARIHHLQPSTLSMWCVGLGCYYVAHSLSACVYSDVILNRCFELLSSTENVLRFINNWSSQKERERAREREQCRRIFWRFQPLNRSIWDIGKIRSMAGKCRKRASNIYRNYSIVSVFIK